VQNPLPADFVNPPRLRRRVFALPFRERHKIIKAPMSTSELLLFCGARRAIVGEPLVWVETYPIQWRKPRIDLAELAKLRWIKDFSRKDLAARFGKSELAIQNYFQFFEGKKFDVPGLSVAERKELVWKSKK
jgi:hypothetical protein